MSLSPKTYQSVHVLLLSWQDCEDAVSTQLKGLQEVIQHYYNYKVEHWEIPSETPFKSLDRRLSHFIDQFDSTETLLIVYYRGHAIKDQNGTALIWKQFNHDTSPALSWKAMQHKLLVDVESDVLVLLDCCYASNAIHIISKEAGSIPLGVVIILAAGSYDEETPLYGNYTFTKNLAAQFEASSSERQSVNAFFVGMVRRAQNWRAIQQQGERRAVNLPAILDLTQVYSDRKIFLERLEVRESVGQSKDRTLPSSGPHGAPDQDTMQGQPYPGVQDSCESQFRPELDAISSAQHWLERLDMMQELLYQEIENADNWDGLVCSPTKIGVLSTGIDLQRPIVRAAHRSKRLAEMKDFSSHNGQENMEDEVGYGTDHIVSLLHMSRYANIYVAKVGGVFSETSILAKAIDHCNTVWGVDLIVIPFGSSAPSSEIDSAIQRACSNGKVIMAASGNMWPPGRSGKVYPASNPNVIGIFSTDGKGNPSGYNYPARESRKNFATLGEAIPGFWKSKAGEPMSGTSASVHVAAALVCTALEYAKSVALKVNSDRQKLFSFDGVEALLSLMSVPRDGFDYVAPWNLWSDERDSEQVQALIRDAVSKLPTTDSDRGSHHRLLHHSRFQWSTLCRWL